MRGILRGIATTTTVAGERPNCSVAWSRAWRGLGAGRRRLLAAAVGASRLARSGIDGTGTTVAVLDTGIDPLPDFAGRLVGGVDLSGEGDPYKDSFGHGTFVAGLIAANGASSGGAYRGEAPGAALVSVKVGGAAGVTDMATVISGIDWVLEHRGQLRIGVLNLSLDTVPPQPTALNPLHRPVA